MNDMDLEDFITRTNNASNPSDVFELYKNALNNFGFDKICYSLLNDHPSLGLKAGHGLMANYEDDWMNHYLSNSYHISDPVPQFCFNQIAPFTWDNEELTNLQTPQQKQIMREAREAHLNDGIAVPIHGIGGELSGMGIASSTGGVDKSNHALSLIKLYSFQFHNVYAEFHKTTSQFKHIHLTQREKEILLWAAEGKSDTVIADIIGISYPTVRFHMNNIFKKLDANDKVLAVVKAIRHGLIIPYYINSSDN